MHKLKRAFIYSLFVVAFFAVPCKATIKVQEIKSPGGLKAWFVENKDTPVISLSFAFKTGSVADPQGKEGLSSIAAAMMLEGAGPLDKQALAGKLQDFAIGIGYSTSLDLFSGRLSTLKENQQEAVHLLNLTLTQPLLKTSSLDRIKEQILTSLANIANDPSYLANKALTELLYNSHPYGRPVEGTPISVPKIRVEDIKNYLKNYLAHDNLIIGLTGNLSPKEAGAFLDKAFAGLPKKAKPLKVPIIHPKAPGSIVVVEQDIPQSTIVFAQDGPPIDDPDMLKAAVLLEILGTGHISRLNEEIREKRGLAYYAGCVLSPSAYSGLLLGSMGTVNAQAKESIALAQTEFRRMRDHGVTLKELENAKMYLIGSFPLRFLNSTAVSDGLLQFQYLKKNITYINERTEKIEAITLEEVNKLAKRLLKPDELTFVVVGKPSGMTASKKHLPVKTKD